MKLDELKKFAVVYVASPYSKYPFGIDQAFADVAKVTAELVRAGVKAYSPIAHTHPVAIYGDIDPFDYAMWLPFDQAMMDVSKAIVVVKMEGWEASYGVQHEIGVFMTQHKPVYYLDPDTLELSVTA